MNKVYLLLGSNAGNREGLMAEAARQIAATCGQIIARSGVYETAAWGIEDQAAFLNQVVCIETELGAEQLLTGIQAIEDRLGRQREVLWGPRTLDIDILFFNLDVIALPHLKVPHPFLQKRRFTLVPMAELAPHMIHPVLHKSISELLEACTDELEVKKVGEGDR